MSATASLASSAKPKKKPSRGQGQPTSAFIDGDDDVPGATTAVQRSSRKQKQPMQQERGSFVSERMQHFEPFANGDRTTDGDTPGEHHSLLEQGRTSERNHHTQRRNNHLAPLQHHSPRPQRGQLPTSFRALLLYFGLIVLLFLLPYLALAPEHSNSCFIVRSPRRVRADAMQTAADVANVTVATGLEVPAADTVSSSPALGRARWPAWFFRHQTVIMIGLLLICLAIKVAYAWLFMRVKAEPAAGGSRQRAVNNNAQSQPPAVPAPAHLSPAGTATFSFAWWEVYRILFCYLFYLAAYFFCNALKSLLRDYSCSDHGNSVSGHYLFHLYAQWTLLWLHLSQKRLDRASLLSPRTWHALFLSRRRVHRLDQAFLLCFTGYTVTCSSILLDTYLFGFHSPRQILYGTLLAVVVFLALTGTLAAVETKIAALRGYHTGHHHRHGRHTQRNNAATVAGDSETAHDGDGEQQKLDTVSREPGSDELAHLPLWSSILHEWCSYDEQNARFYTFPAVVLALFQLVAFVLLSAAPEFRRFFNLHDAAAVLLGQGLLLAIAHFKLKPAPLEEQTGNKADD